MFSPHALKVAYIDSYNKELEQRIGERVGMSGIPLIGGIGSAIGGSFTRIWRPLKLSGAFIFGNADAKPAPVERTEIPEAMRGTALEEAFGKYRGEMQKSILLHAEKWERYASLRIVSGNQKAEAASHQEEVARKVTLPSEEHPASAYDGIGKLAGSALAASVALPVLGTLHAADITGAVRPGILPNASANPSTLTP